MANKSLITDTDHAILLDKFDRLETVDERLQLIYEWVKTGHINLIQFKRLAYDTFIADLLKDVEDKS